MGQQEADSPVEDPVIQNQHQAESSQDQLNTAFDQHPLVIDHEQNQTCNDPSTEEQQPDQNHEEAIAIEQNVDHINNLVDLPPVVIINAEASFDDD